jgi:rhodanese-related sulfurtransferase
LLSSVTDVNPIQAQLMVRQGAVLVDVRDRDDWRAGHPPDALHIPLHELGDRTAELARDRTLVTVSQSGAHSAMIAGALRRSGWTAANLAGGMVAWAQAGLSVVRDAGAG